MSSYKRDAVDGYRRLADNITDALNKPHDVTTLTALLETMRDHCISEYDEYDDEWLGGN